MKKNCRKINQQKFKIEKWLKEKEINYISNGKDMKIHLIKNKKIDKEDVECNSVKCNSIV